MASMFTGMQSTATGLFSAYASFAGTTMLIRSMVNDIIPVQLRSYLLSLFNYFFTSPPNILTLIVEQSIGYSKNEVYEAAEIYLPTRISPSTECLKVSKVRRQKTFSVSIVKGEEIQDIYGGANINWKYCVSENEGRWSERHFEITFDKKDKDKVMSSYLPYVLSTAKEIKAQTKVIKLYSEDICCDDDEDDGEWGSINLEHPSTFDKLAMDEDLKHKIIEDLERFLRRKEFYKRAGKAWKRGYLLYGPPGTGKSSLIACMANYLKFDIYDVELTSLYSNSELKQILLNTSNRSIIVMEDIDCSAEVRDRNQDSDYSDDDSAPSKLTLSGLLNFMDGLWSSCGDERIFVFTTNHKDRIDPALLRPGRMDMHIHMSYCTPCSIRILASNYLDIKRDHPHPLFGEIESLIETVNVTPAEIAEELMKSDDPEVALGAVTEFLKRKKSESDRSKKREAAASEIELSKGRGRGQQRGRINKLNEKAGRLRRFKFLPRFGFVQLIS